MANYSYKDTLKLVSLAANEIYLENCRMILHLTGDFFIDFSRKPSLMAILNVTPDSFSDGGHAVTIPQAVECARQIIADGADIIDVGGESTRPGFTPVPADVEVKRVVPVIQALTNEFPGCIISVDTSKPEVARKAFEAGASILNDVTALENGGEEMCAVLRDFQAPSILMHSMPLPDNPSATGMVAQYLTARLDWACEKTGLSPDYFAFDPGIGFAKDLAQNVDVIANLNVLHNTNRPVLIGASRKSFLGKITGRDVSERTAATTAAVAIAAFLGADILRVHDVPAARDALLVASALRDANGKTQHNDIISSTKK